jgi:hypothetical protein
MKPVRPLTAYHLFFQLERAWLLQNIDSPDNDSAQTNQGYEAGKLIDPLMPNRYREIYMSKTWYARASVKRKHRKSHGKISFQELSRKVASRWREIEEIDPETKKYCTMIAKRVFQSYKEKVKIYEANIAAGEVRSTCSSNTTASAGSYSPSIGNLHKRELQSDKEKVEIYEANIDAGELKSTCSSNSTASAGSYSLSIARSQNKISSTKKTKCTRLASTSTEFALTCTKDEGRSGTSFVANCTGSAKFSFIPEPHPWQKLDMSPLQLGDSILLPDECTEDDTEFSFFPVPPSLQALEDEFLKRCQEQARRLPIKRIGLFECDQRTHPAAMKDVVIDSSTKDLGAFTSSAINDESKDDKMSRKRSASDMYENVCEDMTPLNLGKISLDDYIFTEADSEMLLRALF